LNRLLVILFVIGGFTFRADAFQQSIQPLKHFSQEDGLPSLSVNAIVQDSEGFMWFGTDIGLSRFDGYRFRNYTIIDGLLENRILDLQLDKQGRLWISSQDELCYFENNTFHKADIIGKNENTKITSFKVARNGNLWFTTKDKLFATDSTLNHTVWTSENMDMPLTNPIIQFEDEDGYIWLYNEYDHILKAGEKGIYIIPLK